MRIYEFILTVCIVLLIAASGIAWIKIDRTDSEFHSYINCATTLGKNQYCAVQWDGNGNNETYFAATYALPKKISCAKHHRLHHYHRVTSLTGNPGMVSDTSGATRLSPGRAEGDDVGTPFHLCDSLGKCENVK